MSVSSDKRKVLERVTLKRVQVLLLTLNEATLQRIQFVEARYKERAHNFSDTLDFLIALGWVQRDDNEVRLTGTSTRFAQSFSHERDVAERILETITTTTNDYAALFAGYLVRFTVTGSKAECRPTTLARVEESAVRNFLMDMGAVVYDKERDRFVLNQKHIHLYVWAKNVSGPRTTGVLEKVSRQRRALGTSAEDVVFEYEKVRVGKQFADKVEHVSKKYPFASYDVKSVTVTPGATVDRYIEVKAVSRDSYEFFWTKAELEAAKLLRAQYYLYLLPAVVDGFDFSGLLVFENAYETVYKNVDDWAIEENVIVCRRRQAFKKALRTVSKDSH